MAKEESQTLTIHIGGDNAFISSQSINQSLEKIAEIAEQARKDIFVGSIEGAKNRLFKRLIDIHVELANILRSRNFLQTGG